MEMMFKSIPSSSRLAVAILYPGRGHINPMMNFCNVLISKRPELHIVVIVTEAWIDHLTSQENPKKPNQRMSFLAIPNIVPSHLVRSPTNHTRFIETILRDMHGPVEQALDKLQGPLPDVIIADAFMPWAVDLGTKRNIPVAQLWTMSASVLSVLYHHDLILKRQDYPLDLSEEGGGDERISIIPGISSIRLEDLPTLFHVDMKEMLKLIIEIVSSLSKAQLLVLTTMEELEEPAIGALRNILTPSIYPIGPAIPCFKTKSDTALTNNGDDDRETDYMNWLNEQQERSVLYVSLGSYLETSRAQLEEFAKALRDSEKPVLWVARGEASQLSAALGERGMVIPWCDQTRVLTHPSVGGFLSNCGWNSTLESAFAGVPVLAFPMGAEQTQNRKTLVEDWGIGWNLKRNACQLVEKEEISDAVNKFMDLAKEERKLLDVNSRKLQQKLFQRVDEDGCTSEMQAFLSKVLP